MKIKIRQPKERSTLGPFRIKKLTRKYDEKVICNLQ